MGMNGLLGRVMVGKARCERWGVSDKDHSLRCCVCPMKSAQPPGITMRAEQL